MHKFLRAVGFSDLRKKDIELLIEDIVERPEILKVTTDSEGNEFAELSCEYGKGFGIIVRGTYNEEDIFCPEYYFPYALPKEVSTEEYIDVEKHAEKEEYSAVCDEVRLGVALIFYLQNVADYLATKKLCGSKNTRRGAMLSALSVDGKILLPIMERNTDSGDKAKSNSEHNRLIAQAREGNEEAIENLTLEDMDTYSLLSQRIRNEDVLSIVSTSFMPYGIESDQYCIIGDIVDVSREQNHLTQEYVYNLTLRCNDVLFNVCINEMDLLGEPAIGRRFKGSIWLQGTTIE